jgi:Ca-activated chloride channel homolog
MRHGWVCVAALSLALAVSVEAQFSSRVNVVEVYVTVTDSTGMPVTGLTQDDFTVREDGQPQRIAAFAAGEFPLSVAIALDRSFSMAGARLAAAKSAARLFLSDLGPDDESMLIAVGSETDVLAPLTRDRAPQLAALSALDAFGTTGLYDAIIAATSAVRAARGRRALVLLSDGSDRSSRQTAAESLDHARASDVLIYPVAFGPRRPPIFAELAAVTGGRSFHVDDARRLPDTMRTIAKELKHQYLIGYSPTRPAEAGSKEWRSIAVTVKRAGVRVRARDGYWTAEQLRIAVRGSRKSRETRLPVLSRIANPDPRPAKDNEVTYAHNGPSTRRCPLSERVGRRRRRARASRGRHHSRCDLRRRAQP